MHHSKITDSQLEEQRSAVATASVVMEIGYSQACDLRPISPAFHLLFEDCLAAGGLTYDATTDGGQIHECLQIGAVTAQWGESAATKLLIEAQLQYSEAFDFEDLRDLMHEVASGWYEAGALNWGAGVTCTGVGRIDPEWLDDIQ